MGPCPGAATKRGNVVIPWPAVTKAKKARTETCPVSPHREEAVVAVAKHSVASTVRGQGLSHTSVPRTWDLGTG